MFKIVPLALAACLAFTGPALAADLKIGIFNSQSIAMQSDAAKASRQKLQGQFGKERAQLEKEAAWLAQYCEGQDQCPYLALNWEYNPPDWCQCTDTIEEGFDCYMNPIECWREAARNAIAQGNANDRQ